MNKTKISVQPLEEYLHRQLHESVQCTDKVIAEETLWYLGQMLVRFVDSDQLFNYDRGRLHLPILAFLFRDATTARTKHERISLLRKLGDTALFVGALFPEKYRRKGIGEDYFIGMGGGAYDSLSECCPEQTHIYSELSNSFPLLMKLVSSVCSKQEVFDAQDILMLYQRWQRTQNYKMASQLHLLGVDTGSLSKSYH